MRIPVEKWAKAKIKKCTEEDIPPNNKQMKWRTSSAVRAIQTEMKSYLANWQKHPKCWEEWEHRQHCHLGSSGRAHQRVGTLRGPAILMLGILPQKLSHRHQGTMEGRNNLKIQDRKSRKIKLDKGMPQTLNCGQKEQASVNAEAKMAF